MSRPTRLTPAVQAKFLAALQAGSYRSAAAALVGVSERTLQSWCKKGRDGAGKLYVEFWAALQLAEATASVSMVAVLTKAAREGDWKAAAWWLERRYPQEWGRKDTRTIEAKFTHEQAAPVPWEELGEALAPYPEAKAAFSEVLKRASDKAKAKQIEDKSGE